MVFPVTSQELDTLASIYNSVHILFLGLSFGAALGFGIPLITTDLTTKAYAGFLAVLSVSAIATVYFLARTIVDILTSRSKVRDIRGRS